MSEPVNTPDIKTLLSAIRDLVGEVQPHWKNLHFTPDTHLEKELGLDSMAALIRYGLEHQLDRDDG